MPPTDARAGSPLDAMVIAEARRIAMRVPRDAVPLEDLVAYGQLGLLEAQQRFDPTRGINFESFARHRVRGAIFDGLRSMMIVPQRGQYRALRQQFLAWQLAGDPEPTPTDEVAQVREAEVSYRAILDLATTFLAAESDVYDTEAPADEALAKHSDLARMRAALALLDSEDRALLKALYGLGRNVQSGASFARRRGLHRATVSRRHHEILERLRRLFEAEKPP